jgi:hypothetical protein
MMLSFLEEGGAAASAGDDEEESESGALVGLAGGVGLLTSAAPSAGLSWDATVEDEASPEDEEEEEEKEEEEEDEGVNSDGEGEEARDPPLLRTPEVPLQVASRRVASADFPVPALPTTQTLTVGMEFVKSWSLSISNMLQALTCGDCVAWIRTNDIYTILQNTHV